MAEKKYHIGQVFGAMLGIGIGAVIPPVGERSRQILWHKFPAKLIDPAGLTELKRRGVVSDEEYKLNLQEQGFNANRANQLFQLTKRLADVSELVRLRLRNEIGNEDYKTRLYQIGIDEALAEELLKVQEQRLDPDTIIRAWRRQIKVAKGKPDYFDDLKHQGWTEDRIELLKKVTEFFPAPADLIRFAVREVYTPEIVEEYEMMADLPPKFLTEAKKAGLNEEQAKNYWASHWILPSAGQGFEMLHREVINYEQLETLMRTLDIMPYWREKLIKVAYRPFSRVDVRRMNKIGTLDEEGVKRAYLDLGYDEEKAGKMTDFTLKYNAEPNEDEMTEDDRRKEELKGLTRTAILKQYREEMLPEADAGSYLKGLGYSDEVTDFYLAREDYLREEEKVDGYIKAYHRLYVNGTIDYNNLIVLLGKLNLPDANVKYLTDLWDLEKLTRPSQPSKAELVRFTKKKIINLDTFKEKMTNLGYSLQYIGWYIKDYKLKEAKA